MVAPSGLPSGEGRLSTTVELARSGGGREGSEDRRAAADGVHQRRRGRVAVFIDEGSHSKPKHWRIFRSSAMAYYGASSSSVLVPDVGVDGRGVEFLIAGGGFGLDGISSKRLRVFSVKVEALSTISFICKCFFVTLATE